MVIPEAREISKMSKNHNNALCRGEFGVPTLFDLFSRPLSAFSGFDMENEGFKADVEDKGDRYQVKAEMPGVKGASGSMTRILQTSAQPSRTASWMYA